MPISLTRFPRVRACLAATAVVALAASSSLAQGEATKLALDGAFQAPRWSPDGKMLGLTKPGYHGVYVVRADGSGLRQINDEEAAGYRFAWSADSKQIAFKTRQPAEKGFGYALKVASLAEGTCRTIAERNGSMGVPSWLSSDTLGVLLDDKASVATLNGAITEKPARSQANVVAWVGGSERFLCIEDDQVTLVEADGSRKVLTSPKDGRFYDLQLSPKADKALVHNLDGHLYLIGFDGSKADLGEGAAGTWSPDGKKVLCNVSKDDSHTVTSSDVFVIDVASKARKQLTNTADRIEMYPSFSPDGKQIAYGDGKSGAIFVQNVAEEVAQ